MAASLIPAPGSRPGPCAAPCAHIDCAALRKDAAATCRICAQPIGYARRFYTDPDDASALVHASCLEDQHERATEEPA